MRQLISNAVETMEQKMDLVGISKFFEMEKRVLLTLSTSTSTLTRTRSRLSRQVEVKRQPKAEARVTSSFDEKIAKNILNIAQGGAQTILGAKIDLFRLLLGLYGLMRLREVGLNAT